MPSTGGAGGSLFVVSGTGSAQLYEVNPTDPEAGYMATNMGKNIRSRHGFLKVTLTSDELTAEFVGTHTDFGICRLLRIDSAVSLSHTGAYFQLSGVS